MAQPGRNRKTALSASLILLLLQALGSNAAPIDHVRRAAQFGGPFGGGGFENNPGGGQFQNHPGFSGTSCTETETGKGAIPSGQNTLSTFTTPSSVLVSNSRTPAITTGPAATNAQAAAAAVSPSSKSIVTSPTSSTTSTTTAPSPIQSPSFSVSSGVVVIVSSPITASTTASASKVPTVASSVSTGTSNGTSHASSASVSAIPGVFAETLTSETITPTDNPTGKPATVGTAVTSLATAGESSVQPFATTVISTASGTIAPTSVNSTAAAPSATPLTAGANIFVEISKDPAPYMIGPKDGHPVPRTGIDPSITKPIETNKFYAGLFLSDQTDSVWTHPYSLRWAKGVDNVGSWGMAISHIERSQVVYGDGSPASCMNIPFPCSLDVAVINIFPDFANPIGIDSMILSAQELGSSTVLTTDSHQAFSVNANLASASGKAPLLTLPLVQGMGFVTGIYTSATPLIQSGVFFKSLSPLIENGTTWKTTATLQDNTQWFIYVTPVTGAQSAPAIILNDSKTVQISSGFTGIVQIAKVNGGGPGEQTYDASAGVYPVNGTVSGALTSAVTLSTTGTSTASYSLTWGKAGLTSRSLLMFALPHHVQAFDGATAGAKTNISLQTTTKGIATGVFADHWTMNEQLPSE
jgi:endoglucanase Acf2